MQTYLKGTANRLSTNAAVLLPLGLIATSTVYERNISDRHSLSVATISWGIVALWLASKTGLYFRRITGGKLKLTIAAGILFALALIYERAAEHKGGVRWTKVRLEPLDPYTFTNSWPDRHCFP